jgi:putative ABC transport system permease protein
LREATVGNVQTALLVLLVAVLLVLLIACANVANLLLARAASRYREIAVRTALGAARGRIIRQLLTESLLLGLLGGVAGLLLAWWGVRALVGLEPNLPRLAEVTVDGQVLAFTFALTLLTSLIFGLAPALQATRGDLNEALKEGGRSGGSGARTHRIRNVLVVAEIAMALVLSVSAGLMINSLMRMQRIDPGFRTHNILTMQIALPNTSYPDERLELATSFYKQLAERVAALPGVQTVGMTSALPLTASGWGKLLSVEGRPMPKSFEDIPVIQFRQVNADYFAALAISLLQGRAFTRNDTRDSMPVAVINEALARRHFSGEDPLGKRIWLGPPEEMIPPEMIPPGFDLKTFRMPRFTVVGVIKDVLHSGLTQQSTPEVYILHEQTVLSKFPDTARSMYLAIRTTAEPLSLTNAVRHEVQELDKEQPIADVATMDQLLAVSLSQSRLSALLLLIFAGVALALASVGIYGVMSYSVTERIHEIGIRMALGAERRDVLWLVIRRGMMLAGSGLLIGLGGALGLTRLMESLLFNVSATDPLTFTAIALLLAGVALVACYLPARRATKIDPMIALRYE